MIPSEFPEVNVVFRHPQASDLPVYMNGEMLISRWKLTEEELCDIARTGEVWLSVIGTGHPPVRIGTRPDELDEKAQ